VRASAFGQRARALVTGLSTILAAWGAFAGPTVVPQASEATFGDVVVRAEQAGGGTVTHGYTESRFEVTNLGPQQHTVTIIAPSNRFNYTPGSIAELSRSVVLAPGSSAMLSVLQPALPVSGHGAEVLIDGTGQEPMIPFAPVYTSGPTLRILASRAVSDTDLRTALEMHFRADEFEIQTATTETSGWSGNWLSLSSYDALVVTNRELDATDTDVRQALDRFTRTGGVLVILDALPDGDCAGRVALPEALTFCTRGFGLRVTTTAPLLSLGTDDVKRLTDEIRATQQPLLSWGGSIHPTKGPDFAVVEDLSVPLRGLFIGMILFAITAGPLNIMVLSKMNRRIWIIWTLPAIAIVTSVLVIAIATFSEGWVRAARTDAITWIDPETREATTIGWTGFYATVAPGDGLRFDPQTEIQPFGGSRNNLLKVDWTSGQHLSSGWLSSRVTSTFRVRKSEPRRERLTFRQTGNGISVSNGLGSPIGQVWVTDQTGRLWSAKEIGEGETEVLEATEVETVSRESLRDLYKKNWLAVPETVAQRPGDFLAPGQWMAIMDGSPFVEDAMKGIRTRNGKSVVVSELRFGGAE
jgi:hypothetical protein